MDIKKIKQRLREDTDLATASKRRDELNHELQTAQAAHRASAARLQESFATNDDKRAQALIEGRGTAGVDSLRETELRDRERVTLYKRAIELHSQTMNHLHHEISAAICRELFEEHAKLGDAIADAALKLREANRLEMAFRDQLETAGVRVDLQPKVFLYFQTLEGVDSFLDRYISERKAA